MKILYLVRSIHFPPVNNEDIRNFNLISRISRKNEVAVLGFASWRQAAEEFKEAMKGVRVIGVRKKDSWYDFLEYFLTSFFSSKPYELIKYACPKMADVFEKTARDGDFDIIHISGLCMSQYALKDFSSKLFLDHNKRVIAQENGACNKKLKGLQKLYMDSQAKKTEKYEVDILSYFKTIFTSSEEARMCLCEYAESSNVEVVSDPVCAQEQSQEASGLWAEAAGNVMRCYDMALKT